jgi:hypothetical protein
LALSESFLVEVRLKRFRWMMVTFVPFLYNKLIVSLEEPQAFVDALGEAIARR